MPKHAWAAIGTVLTKNSNAAGTLPLAVAVGAVIVAVLAADGGMIG